MAGVDGEGRRSKRARARAMKARAPRVADGARASSRAERGSTRGCPRPMPPTPKQIEYRLQVKPVGHGGRRGQRAHHHAAQPREPGAAACRARCSSRRTSTRRRIATRSACSRASRTRGPRRVGIDVRGEDASDLLPLLKGRRVIVEPQMMELRFGDEPLRPRFDLELSPDGAQIVVRTAFQRQGDPRRFTTTSGAWFEGSPGWYVDAQEGWARPIDRRVSPAAMRRLLRLPVITEPVERLPELVMQGLPKVALEVGAELPELSQVADVVDLEPDVPRRGGRHARRGAGEPARRLRGRRDRRPRRRDDAAGDRQAAAPTPPLPGATAAGDRARRSAARKCIRCDIAAQQDAAGEAARPGPRARRRRQQVHRPRRRRHPLLDRGHRDAARRLGHLRARRSRRRAGARRGASAQRARRRAASTGSRLRLNFESEGVAVTQDELARCLAEGRKYVRLADGTFARIDPQKVREVLQRQAEILATGGGNGGRLPALAGRPHRGAARPGRAGRASPATRRSSSRSSRTSTRSRARASRATSRRSSARTRSRAFTGSGSSTRSAAAASSPTTWASARRCRRSRCCSP